MTHKYNATYIDQEKKRVALTYTPLPVVLSKGKGCWVWDVEGKKYLDMVSAYSALSHGHCHPALVKVLHDQALQLSLCSRAFYSDQLALFSESLCTLTGFDRVLPMNTGAEAVETALKAARRWGYRVKGIPGQAEIIVAENNFHGRTTTIVSFSTEENYRQHFGPFTPGFVTVPYGDSQAIEKAITPHTVAILLEPMQGEAGIIIPPKGYLSAVKQLADKNNVLLILDEIQTGLGRTGKLFAYHHEGIKPHGLILGKALGGGLLPVSAFLTSNDVMDCLTPGSHGSTFGGNPLACAVAHKALDILIQDNYSEKSARGGAYFKNLLMTLKHPCIKEIRGKGLWIGLELYPSVKARDVAVALSHRGLLCKETHDTVIRLAPPLIITQTEIDKAFDILQEVFNSL